MEAPAAARVVTLVVHANLHLSLAQLQRAVTDGLAVLRHSYEDGAVCGGAGASELLMAAALRYARIR